LLPSRGLFKLEVPLLHTRESAAGFRSTKATEAAIRSTREVDQRTGVLGSRSSTISGA
jgi:hypothetical protein